MLRAALAILSSLDTLESFKSVFKEKRCPLCNSIQEGEARLCANCTSKIISYSDRNCHLCGHETDFAGPVCTVCKADPPEYNRLYFYGIYGEVMRKMIINWKFNNEFGLSSVFDQFIRHLCRRNFHDCKPDLIIPVPLHSSRLRTRGFNQSRIIAQSAASALSIPLSDNALQRTRKTIPQATLAGKKRKNNLQKAFRADKVQIKNRRVLLVDDVFTTGTTANECTRTLLDAGAAQIEIMTLARTLI